MRGWGNLRKAVKTAQKYPVLALLKRAKNLWKNNDFLAAENAFEN